VVLSCFAPLCCSLTCVRVRRLMSALKRWRKSPLSERVLHLRYEDDDVERGAKEEAERVAGLVATADSKKSAAKRRASMWA